MPGNNLVDGEPGRPCNVVEIIAVVDDRDLDRPPIALDRRRGGVDVGRQRRHQCSSGAVGAPHQHRPGGRYDVDDPGKTLGTQRSRPGRRRPGGDFDETSARTDVADRHHAHREPALPADGLIV